MHGLKHSIAVSCSLFALIALSAATILHAAEQSLQNRDDNSVVLGLYNYSGAPGRTLDDSTNAELPIVLNVPSKYFVQKPTGSSKLWGVSFLTFYPSFTSVNDPENAQYINCNGYCGNRILLSIENDSSLLSSNKPIPGDIREKYSNMGDMMARNFIKRSKDSYSRVRQIGPQHGFDDSFEEKFGTHTDYVFLYRHSADRSNYDLATQCTTTEVASTCILYFSPKCMPGLLVKVVGIEKSEIDQFGKVADDVSAFVSRMIRSSDCY